MAPIIKDDIRVGREGLPREVDAGDRLGINTCSPVPGEEAAASQTDSTTKDIPAQCQQPPDLLNRFSGA